MRKKEEDFINLIESYSPGKNDNIISEYILKLYEMQEATGNQKMA